MLSPLRVKVTTFSSLQDLPQEMSTFSSHLLKRLLLDPHYLQHCLIDSSSSAHKRSPADAFGTSSVHIHNVLQYTSRILK